MDCQLHTISLGKLFRAGVFCAVLFAGSLIYGTGESGQISATSQAYELQLNSFKVKSNAQRFFKRLEKKGYKPFMTYTQEKEPWFKVRLGPYPNWEAAKKVSEELKQDHKLASLILLSTEHAVPPVVSKVSIRAQQKPVPVKRKNPHAPNVKKVKNVSTAPENNGNSIDVVLLQFLAWQRALQEKQLDSYFSFYAKNFQSGGTPFEDWEQGQRKSLADSNQLKIEVEDIEFLEKGDTIEMSFIENFQSDVFSELRHKVMIWKKLKGQWKIVKESSEPA